MKQKSLDQEITLPISLALPLTTPHLGLFTHHTHPRVGLQDLKLLANLKGYKPEHRKQGSSAGTLTSLQTPAPKYLQSIKPQSQTDKIDPLGYAGKSNRKGADFRHVQPTSAKPGVSTLLKNPTQPPRRGRTSYLP